MRRLLSHPSTFQAGLAVEEGNQLCLEGLRKTAIKIREGHGGAVDQDRARHGMADPEIQAILADPMVNQALRDLSVSFVHSYSCSSIL
jgi:stress-induced-phosphoprotein 1